MTSWWLFASSTSRTKVLFWVLVRNPRSSVQVMSSRTFRWIWSSLRIFIQIFESSHFHSTGCNGSPLQVWFWNVIFLAPSVSRPQWLPFWTFQTGSEIISSNRCQHHPSPGFYLSSKEGHRCTTSCSLRLEQGLVWVNRKVFLSYFPHWC